MNKEDGIYAMRFASQQMLIDKLQKENKQLKNNWNELKEHMIKEQTRIVIENTDEDEFVYTDLLNKMQKIEGSDE